MTSPQLDAFLTFLRDCEQRYRIYTPRMRKNKEKQLCP